MGVSLTGEGRTWLITGCSGGLGAALAEAALADGDRVVATARSLERLPDSLRRPTNRIEPVQLDVTDGSSIERAVERAIRRFGSLEVAVNNAGYCYLSSIEAGDENEIRRIFDTNFFGIVALTKAVVPIMKSAGQGTIVNISSAAGVVGLEGMGYYCATKFAVEGMSDALAAELAPHNVDVLVVQPGAMWSNFTRSSLVIAGDEHPEYSAVLARKAWFAAAGESEMGCVRRAAGAVVRHLASPANSVRLVLGERARSLIEQKSNALIGACQNAVAI